MNDDLKDHQVDFDEVNNSDGVSSVIEEQQIAGTSLASNEATLIPLENNIENALKLILKSNSPEAQRMETVFSEKVPKDYKYEISADKPHMIVVAAAHDRLPDSPKNKKIEEWLDTYLHDTAAHPEDRLIILEGGGAPALPTREESIIKSGEVGAVAYRLKNEKAEVVTFEPTDKELADDLKQQGVDEGDIALFYATRGIYGVMRGSALKDQRQLAPTEIYKLLGRVSKNTTWQYQQFLEAELKIAGVDDQVNKEQLRKDFVDATLPLLNEKMRQQSGIDLVSPDYQWGFDPEDKELEISLLSPEGGENESATRKVSRLSSEIRDRRFVQTIDEGMRKGKVPFAMAGSSHVFRTKSALATLYKEITEDQNPNTTIAPITN